MIGKLFIRDKLMIKFGISILLSSLLLGVGVRVMLIRNCDVGDGFVNGVMGYVFYFVYGCNNVVNNVVVIGVIFDNINVGNKFGKKIRNGNNVLIERI